MRQDFAVRGRLEQAPLVLEVNTQQRRIDDIAVVRHREIARVVAEKERLHVLDATTAGGGIAHMPDGHVALERREVSLAEHLGHQAAALDAAERRVFRRMALMK